MIQGSTVRKIGMVARAMGQLAGRSRTKSAFLKGIRATAASFGRVLHQLWLEVTGFTFLAIAGIGALAGIREYGRYQAGHAAGPAKLILAGCFTVTFAWFGVSSFWRVKKKKRLTAETPRKA
jgi:hypothetical protein